MKPVRVFSKGAEQRKEAGRERVEPFKGREFVFEANSGHVSSRYTRCGIQLNELRLQGVVRTDSGSPGSSWVFRFLGSTKGFPPGHPRPASRGESIDSARTGAPTGEICGRLAALWGFTLHRRPRGLTARRIYVHESRRLCFHVVSPANIHSGIRASDGARSRSFDLKVAMLRCLREDIITYLGSATRADMNVNNIARYSYKYTSA